MKETNIRSITKAVSWRAIATLITFSIAFFLTGELTIALEIGALDMIIKLLAYFFHERIWGSISLGKILHPLAEVQLKAGIDKNDVLKKLKELGYVNE